MEFLNQRRLRDYPRLMLLAGIAILAVNLLFHVGWKGAFGQIIGIDYLLFYSTGLIFRDDPAKIYNFEAQHITQNNLISPTELPAVNPYFNPPYVALPHSWLTYVSFPNSLLIWSILSLIFIIFSIYLLLPLLPSSIKWSGLTLSQLILVTFSFFPFIEGFQAGQNHTLTLLLVSLISILSISDRLYLAGIAAGLLLYKPQFVLGFLIIWLASRKFKAVFAFSVVGIIWIGTFLARNGISIFHDYLVVSSMLLKLPYDEGFPTYLLVTPYGFLTSILPESFWILIYRATQVIMILASAFIAREAYLSRNYNANKIIYLYGMAILFPLIATPYALLHDLLILIPFFIILSRIHKSDTFLLLIIGTYTSGLILPLVGYLTNIAIPALITITITIFFLRNLSTLKKSMNTNEEFILGREI